MSKSELFSSSVKTKDSSKIPIYVFYRNHFDLIWRRCWQHSYEMKGKVWRGYADLQEQILNQFLCLAEKEGAAFEVEQALTLRDYLHRNPSSKNRLIKLYKSGKFAVVGCGEAIIDSNQCYGETLIRNLSSGMHYLHHELGIRPELGGHFDGFGSSAQMPQIFRQAGMRWLAGLSYSTPDAPYWRGLDGSVIFTRSDVLTGSFGDGDYFYDHCYYTPCVNCSGHTQLDDPVCPSCRGTGFEWSEGSSPDRGPFEPKIVNNYATLIVRSEEMLPDKSLPEWIRNENECNSEYGYVWGTHRAIIPYWEKEMSICDTVSESLISTRIENNPTQSGCLVSRMRVKLAAREAERLFFASERLLTLLCLHGLISKSPSLESVWLKLPLLYFHDAITGTHIDPAQDELLEAADDLIRECERKVRQILKDVMGIETLQTPLVEEQKLFVFNPADRNGPIGLRLPEKESDKELSLSDRKNRHFALRPRVPTSLCTDSILMALQSGSSLRPEISKTLHTVLSEGSGLSMTPVKVVTGAEPKVLDGQHADNGLIQLHWDEGGLLDVIDLATGHPLSSKQRIRPNTLILEHDIGDPWGTRDFHRPRRELEDTRLVSALRYDGCIELLFVGAFLENRRFAQEVDPSVFGLEWTQTVRLWDGVARVDFITEIYWKSSNRRIRVAFPTTANVDKGIYGIPAGYLERDRYEMEDNRLYSPNGDWPAVDFFSTIPESKRPGTAVFNKGTVSSRIEDGVMMMSLLRSPGFGHCLERYAQDYPMPMYSLRDPGYHCFEYALAPVDSLSAISSVAAEAEAFNWNAFLFPQGSSECPKLGGLEIENEAISLLALKSPLSGEGYVLRFLNRSPCAVTSRVTIPHKLVKVERTTILEEPGGELSVEKGGFSLSFTPWEIQTVRLTVSGLPAAANLNHTANLNKSFGS